MYAKAKITIVLTQVLQGAGGGIAAASSQIGAQGSVPHQDVALATAAILLSAELGNVVGTAAAGAIWSSRLPIEIASHFPSMNRSILLYASRNLTFY